MSSVNSGYEVVVRLQVDRSDPDAAIAELQRGVTVPVRYVAEGPGATPATPSAPTSSPVAEPVTFGTLLPVGAPGATPLFTPAPSANQSNPAGAFADSLRQPIPIRLDFDPARAELRRFAEEMRSLLPVIAPTAPARLGGEQFSLGVPYAVAGQNLNGGSIRSNAETLNVVREADSARPATEAAPPTIESIRSSRTLVAQTAQELSETFGIDLAEAPKPIAAPAGDGPPRRPASSPASGTPDDQGEPIRQPIPVTLDLSQARQQIEQLAAEAASRMRSVLLGVTPGPTGAASGPAGGERTTSSVAETPEELYRRESAAVTSATQHAVDYARRTGNLPTAGQLRRRFPDLQSPEAVQDVLGEARGQRQDQRAIERQRYSQDTADFAEFRRQEREAERPARGQEEPEEEQELPAGADARRAPRQSNRLLGLRPGRLGQFVTGGFIANEVLGVFQSQREYRDHIGLAEGAQDRLAAEQQQAQAVFGVPIVGKALDIATEQSQYEIHRTLADATRQDQRTELARSQGAAQLDLRNRADIAGARGFGREAIGIDQANRAEQRAIQDRARERGISNQRETEARQSQIEHDYDSNRPDDVPEAYNYVARLIGAPTVVTEHDQSHDAAVEAARRAADYRTKVSVARQRDDQAEASRLDAENRRQIQLDRDYAGSGYDIAGERATLSGLPYADRNRERQIFTGQTAREAAELGRQNDPNLVAAYRRQRAGEELGLEASFVRDDRSFRADTIQRETAIASTGARERNQPFEAQIVEIAGSTRAALAAPPPQNLTLFQQQQRAAGIAAEGVAKQQEAVATFERGFYQQTIQLGYQRQQAEANLAFRPLDSQLLAIDAEHVRRNAEVDALPIPLQPQRRAEIGQLFGIQGRDGDLQRQARQQFQVQGAFERRALEANVEQLDLTVNGPGSPQLRGLLGQARGIVRSTQAEEARVISEGRPELAPIARQQGVLQEQALRAEFVSGFHPEEVNLNRTALNGPGTADPAAVLAEITADIAKIQADAEKLATVPDIAQKIWTILSKLVPDTSN